MFRLKIKFIKKELKESKLLNELYEDSIGDDTFKSAKEAIRWCNEMFMKTNDRKYKQIANYLHIYL